MEIRRKVAVVAAAAGFVPVLAAGPALAATRTATQTRTATFSFGGSSLDCLVVGISGDEHPYEGREGATLISASTSVGGDDPRCREAVFEVLVLGRYETAPGSGTFRSFSASAGVGEAPRPGGVATQLEVAGPVGAIEVDHTVRFVCDGPTDPTLCTTTAHTSPK